MHATDPQPDLTTTPSPAAAPPTAPGRPAVSPPASYGWLARRRRGNALAIAAETEARRARFELQREMDRYAAARRERPAGGRHARPDDSESAGAERRSTWTASKVLSAVALLLTYSLVVVAMAIAAIAFQTGFLNRVLPEGFKEIEVFFLPWSIELSQVAPVALEFTAWVLALTTVALALRDLPYSRWHRAMWGISLFVAASNGWHIADATRSASLGVAYGAFSIVGPAMIHYYVLFLALLRSGVPVRQALTEARGDLLRSVVRALATVLKIVLGAIFHPRITIRSISIMSGHPQLTYMQARWIANGAYRQKLLAEVRAFTDDDWAPARPGWWAALSSMFGVSGGRDDTPGSGSGTAAVQPSPGAVQGVQGVRDGGVREPGEGVQHRPETPLSTAGDDGVHGGVQTAVLDPADRADDAVHGGVQDDGTAAIRRALENPAGFEAEFHALVRTLGTPPAHDDRDGVQDGARDGVHGGVQDRDQGRDLGVQDQEGAGARGREGTVQADPVHGTGGGVHGDTHAPQHSDVHGDQGVQHTPGHGVRSGVPGPRARRAKGARAAESTGERNYEQALIVHHFWTLVHAGEDVHACNRTEIAALLFGEEQARSKRSTVSRTWAACIKGKHPDPTVQHASTRAAHGDTAA